MSTTLTAEEALTTIMDGNDRWAKGQPQYPKHGLDHSRAGVKNGQDPFAVVLGCSDSRKPVELIMDVGLGDVFVVRNAGHTVCDCTLASIEYGVMHLGAPLVMVVGHQRCGAVMATISSIQKEGVQPGHIDHIVAKIAPAVRTAMAKSGSDDLIEAAVRIHIKRTVGQLLVSQPVLGQMVRERQLTVVGAYYNLETRRLNLLSSEAQVRTGSSAVL